MSRLIETGRHFHVRPRWSLPRNQRQLIPQVLRCSPWGHSSPWGGPMATRGFTLVEVLVALGIVAIALAAGVRSTAALTRNAERQSDLLLAQLCAENTLVAVRLAKQMPPVGDNTSNCDQAGRTLNVTLSVRPTPNPNFLRVEARVAERSNSLLALSTVVGRY